MTLLSNIDQCLFPEPALISSLEAQKFLEEALRMREFDHPHILRLIGIALDKEDMPLVVLPYMKHGDLLSYIRNELNVSAIQLLILYFEYSTQKSSKFL